MEALKAAKAAGSTIQEAVAYTVALFGREAMRDSDVLGTHLGSMYKSEFPAWRQAGYPPLGALHNPHASKAAQVQAAPASATKSIRDMARFKNILLQAKSENQSIAVAVGLEIGRAHV